MIKTYNLLNGVRSDNYKKFTNEQLARLYQRNNDDLIIAELFCRNFGYWFKLSNLINFIHHEEKASFILENINYALKNYNIRKGVGLVTYTSRYIYNTFGGLKTKRKFKSREQESMIISLENPNCDTHKKMIDSIQANNNDFDTCILKLTIDTDKSLTDLEKRLCYIFIDNPRIEIKEISKEMNITTQYVWIIKKRLAKKLRVSLCFDE